jgi:hypothetical protein
MPHTPSSDGDIRALVENFTNEFSQVIRRAALEEVHAKLTLAIGDVATTRRGPGRPRGARTGKRGRPGKFTPEQMEKLGTTIVGLLKKSPGARSEQLSVAMKMDAKTLRIPLQALIKAKKIKVKGQKRGTTYFVWGRP